MTTAFLATQLAFRYAAFRARRRLKLVTPLIESAKADWTIAPAEARFTGPAYSLPGEIDKVRELEARTDWTIERMRVSGGEVNYPEVRAYRLSDAALYRGAIFCKSGVKRIRPYGDAGPSGAFPAISIREGALAGSYLGLVYFGHWVRDDLTLALLSEGYGEPVTPTTRPWPHIEGYRRLTDIDVREEENVRFGSLVFFDDEEVTPHKCARLEVLRERVAAKVSPAAGTRRVFLSRGGQETGARRFVNEADIAEALKGHGFAIVDPGKASADEIAQIMQGAELVVGAEGSQLSHAVPYLRRGGGLLAITAPDRFCTSHKRWTDLLGMKYGFVVGDPHPEEGFTAAVDNVLRTIDMFEKRPAVAAE